MRTMHQYSHPAHVKSMLPLLGGESIAHPPLAPPFRWATLADGRRLAELLNMAGEGIPEHLWRQASGDEVDPLDVGEKRAQREEANFSYRNALAIEQDGSAVGMVLSYPLLSDPCLLDDVEPVLRPLLELEEAAAGTFYINAIAVLPAYQGRGWGGWLLRLAHRVAETNGYDTTTLLVFEENESAVRFYRNYGYRVVERRRAVPHECHPYTGHILLMAKAL